jgi:hypothetical protein
MKQLIESLITGVKEVFESPPSLCEMFRTLIKSIWRIKPIDKS